MGTCPFCNCFPCICRILKRPLMADIREGDKLVADGGFTCLEEDDICEVVKVPASGELAVRCRAGYHTLDGQLDKAGKLIGFMRAE